MTELDAFVRVVVDERRRDVSFDFLAKRSSQRTLIIYDKNKKTKQLEMLFFFKLDEKLNKFTRNVNMRLSLLNEPIGRTNDESFLKYLQKNKNF